MQARRSTSGLCVLHPGTNYHSTKTRGFVSSEVMIYGDLYMAQSCIP